MSRSRGMSLITAIFLLLILAALGTYIVSISGAQQSTSALDLMGSRAYHAARAGVEFGTYQAISAASCPASTPLALSGNFGGFESVTVKCQATTFDEGGTSKILYLVTAIACNQPTAGGICPPVGAPGANYVERQLQGTVINPP